MSLDAVQVRVLGSLIEKEITTPENYPLSLNALVNACNQRSSRDPVLELTDDEVRQALHTLEDQGFITTVHDARVPKYEHRARTVLNLRRDETAVICLLMLRGPQTPGELRGRSERLYAFDDISSVQSTLDRLASREASTEPPASPGATGPLVVMLPRQPGSRESRYAHLLSGAPEIPQVASSSSTPYAPSLAERVTELESALNHLNETLATLQARVQTLESSS
ncbi:YceH family protein [Edaphobacter albus]|uniref:YceH family protein n=1 Tax=Edaphobacter sp. 4G125 TaxID=2763071 RepID=UPI0016475309|nr:YceH family protein [Edaphobacter sp. 4G125]QNI37406.1 YceH family protein [Edaphobacter sp. 4G125]